MCINGFVRGGGGGVEGVWLQRRAADKQTWPGKLDHLVGGGLTSGLGIRECALKEALEEANLEADYAEKNMVSAGMVSFLYDVTRGIYPSGEFVFDLELDKVLERGFTCGKPSRSSRGLNNVTCDSYDSNHSL